MRPNVNLFASSPRGLPVLSYQFFQGGPQVLILGGVHGDEIEGVWAAQALLYRFMQNFPYRLNLTLVPEFNIEGVLERQRSNSRGVDLNRNLPTRDWTAEVLNPRYNPGPSSLSEPENMGLVQYIEQSQPRLIVSLHSWKPVLNVNGDCRPEAEVLAKLTGYSIEESIGYPTPGCLGSYAGLERKSPTITYEIERGLNASEVLRVHPPAILEMLKITEKRNSWTTN
ncbi:MAG: succinylglutamate desuccinylase/aspartoacylase family protein [Bdellovibrionaceae bacterium]|nr:succinylglutamate desuccinylase/aspartoacylase family protein [Pseudobdellovibrionaceae bacterium]